MHVLNIQDEAAASMLANASAMFKYPCWLEIKWLENMKGEIKNIYIGNKQDAFGSASQSKRIKRNEMKQK